MYNGKKFAFLGKSFSRFFIFIVIATVGLITEKVINYNYVVVQKNVQAGEVSENWQTYMLLAGAIILVSLMLRVIKVFFTMWIEKIQKVNFFKAYNGVIQEDGKLQGALKDLTVASAKVYCVIETIETIINSAYIVLLMGIVSLSIPEYIGAIAILFCGISLGLYRGKLQAKTDLLGAETQSLEQKLSNFFMISSNVLGERLNEIEGNYWRRIGLQCVKNTIQVLPDVVKVIAFVALFYNITATGMAEGEVYPYTYVVLTAYGYIVALASNVSNLLEYASKILLYKHDNELQELKEEMKKKKEEINGNLQSVMANEEGIAVRENFTAGLTRPNGEEVSYKIPETLILKKGEMIMLEGENGTGKSRFCKLLKEIIPNAICYDVKTSIVEIYHENFRRDKSNIDFNLIKYLAEGLALERIPKSKKEFFNLKCSSINSADRQMLIALQILYFAIKEYEEGKTKLIILDEILGNLSLERTKKVLPFIAAELSKIGACTIIVSHSYKEEVRQYISVIWQMYNKENEVIIEEKPV